MVEWVKRSILRWFGHIERIGNEEFVKRVYLSSVEGTNRRGKPLGRWEDKVKEYVSERGVRGNGKRKSDTKNIYGRNRREGRVRRGRQLGRRKIKG